MKDGDILIIATGVFAILFYLLYYIASKNKDRILGYLYNFIANILVWGWLIFIIGYLFICFCK